MLERNVRRLGSVSPVEGAFGDLDNNGGIGEGQSLEICGILTRIDVRLDNKNICPKLRNAQEWGCLHQ
jgi:hypothetical protein